MTALPSVVLRTIATTLINDLDDDDDDGLRNQAISTLCALRLTCLDLAEMAHIKSALFSNIDLHATQDNMVKVEQTDFSAIGPFIRQIDFIPSPYFCNLDMWEFKHMLDLHYALINEAPEICVLCVEESRNEIDLQRANPLSQDEVETFHRSYLERADEDRRSALEGSLPRVWLKMLVLAKHVDTVKLCSVSKGMLRTPYHIKQPAPGRCRICSDNSGSIWNPLVGQSGDCLMSAVVETLAATSLAIKSFSIDCELRCQPVAEWCEPYWERLSLSQVETVTISELPYGLRDSRDMSDVYITLDRDGNAQESFLDVLGKVHETMQHIKVVRDYLSDAWPSTPDLGSEFPCLRSLHVQGIVFPPSFTDFIAMLPALDTLKLKACSMDGGDFEFKDLFDSLRKRPSPLHLSCEEMPFEYWDFDSGIGINAGGTEKDNSSQGGPSLQKSLSLYLSGCGDWDAILQMYFPEIPE